MLDRVNELDRIESEKEQKEKQLREELMLRLIKSRNNNLKLFSLKSKGDNFC